ncbi:hypothetical protein [Echinicola shivajiensis]|uniref:hypothetical protein n=1 Tax=Echinicola shivajiensis TaxID=1035916 RepID=UPI001BFC29D6|nr:hypothetical protein [Echinicola shivajiensis]
MVLLKPNLWYRALTLPTGRNLSLDGDALAFTWVFKLPKIAGLFEIRVDEIGDVLLG